MENNRSGPIPRPFYFNIVFWGERFRNYLLSYCIPSLLAPGNLPCLSNKIQNKFLLCCPQEDWDALQGVPIFLACKQHIAPVHIAIPYPEPDTPSCIHMGIGHTAATEMAFRDKAYFVALTPDLIVSDGVFRTVEQHARNGAPIVYTVALRFSEEHLFKAMRREGLLDDNAPLATTAKPLVANGRQLVRVGLESFHSETLRYEWAAPYYSESPVATFWRVPNHDGCIIYSFSWAPLLLDYGTITAHNTETFKNWTFDGDYVYKNFNTPKKIVAIQDSDEAMLVSWAPWADKFLSLEPRHTSKIKLINNLKKSFYLYKIYYSKTMDPLKRHLFNIPVYWHADDYGSAYIALTKRTKYEILLYRIFNKYIYCHLVTVLSWLLCMASLGKRFFVAAPNQVLRIILQRVRRYLPLGRLRQLRERLRHERSLVAQHVTSIRPKEHGPFLLGKPYICNLFNWDEHILVCKLLLRSFLGHANANTLLKIRTSRVAVGLHNFIQKIK